MPDCKPTLQATQEALEAMRQHLLTENSPNNIIKTGEIFPLEMMQTVYELYYKNWDNNTWGYDRLCCYSTFVIGYVPRFFVADDLLRLLRGLGNKPDDQAPLLYGNFKQKIYFNGQDRELDFTHPDKYADFRLGQDYFVDVYYGAQPASCAIAAGGAVSFGNEPVTPHLLRGLVSKT